MASRRVGGLVITLAALVLAGCAGPTSDAAAPTSTRVTPSAEQVAFSHCARQFPEERWFVIDGLGSVCSTWRNQDEAGFVVAFADGAKVERDTLPFEVESFEEREAARAEERARKQAEADAAAEAARLAEEEAARAEAEAEAEARRVYIEFLGSGEGMITTSIGSSGNMSQRSVDLPHTIELDRLPDIIIVNVVQLSGGGVGCRIRMGDGRVLTEEPLVAGQTLAQCAHS